MIQVVHLITGLEVGGAETALYRLIDRMDRGRFNNRVVSFTSNGPIGDLIAQTGVEVVALGVRGKYRAPGGVIQLVRMMRDWRPDVLQTWLHHADFLGLLAARFAGNMPTLWNLRCSRLDRKDHPASLFALLKVLALISRAPAGIIANSQAGIDEHKAIGYHPKRWELISNGFDLDHFKPSPSAYLEVRKELGVAPDTFLIGLVARYDPMKDHPTFLKAVARAINDGLDAKFVMAGLGIDKQNKKLTGLIQQLGIGANIHMLGRRNDIARLNAAFDIASLCSYSEGFPNSVGEAMACGVPCAVTDAGDARAIIGDTGITVPVRDPVALASAWRRLFDEGADARKKRGAAARERIARRYSMAHVVKQYEDLYTRLASEGGLKS